MSQNFKAVIEGIPPAIEGLTIYTEALHLMVDQRNSLIADDWSTLKELANQGLGLAHRAYREMRRSLGTSRAVMSEINSKFETTIRSHAKDEETREAFFLQVREELLKINPDIDQGILDGLDAMGEGKLRGNSVLDLLANVNAESEPSDRTATAIDATAALAARSVMGLTYNNFHQHEETLAAFDFGPFPIQFLDFIRTEIDFFQAELENGLKNLYRDIVSGESPVLGAENLTRIIEESLPKLGRIQATIRKYALFLKDEGKGTVSEKAGKLAALASDLTRVAFTAEAAAYYLTLHDIAFDQDPKVKNLLSKADQLGFDTNFPNGKDTEISKVDQLEDGDYVEVAGFVDSIIIGRDSDDKLITQISLHDPSSDTNVVAAAIFVHLRHIGLLEGAYCQLSGYWQSQSGINNGNPAIEIEKLPINELSSRSWKIAFLDIADKFVDRWPGGLNIKFGLSPHVSAADAGESQILGAGEIIFKPFIR